MKKSKERKLSLDKFTVCKLDNLRKIKGGDDQEKKTTTSKNCPPPEPTGPHGGANDTGG